jgi:hypothetical protein
LRDQPTPLASTPRFAAPIWTLLLLAPFVAEVLSGSTRTSILFVYLPEVMVWGVGALLCRELARRWQAGGVSLLLLGLALSIAEEFIIQQTSLAPIPFPGSHPDYGRMWGLNLVYLLFMLAYESVWVVVVPVQLTELFFPQRAAQPWLRKRGAIVGCVVFLLGSRIAWYGWTQQARPRLHAAPYSPPLGLILTGLLTIGLLVAVAWLARNLGRSSPGNGRRTAPVWLVALTAFVMASAWFDLITQYFIPKPVEPFWIAIIAGAAWAALAFTLFVWWSSRQAWREVHRFAAASAAALACMASPYWTISTWPKIDMIGKMIFDALALVGIFILARKVFARSSSAKANAPSEPEGA